MMKGVGLLAIVAAAAAVFTGTSATASTACRVSNWTAWGTNYSQPGGAGANCAYGTTLTFTNKSFVCNQPLSQYGTLPLRVIVNEATPGGWGNANAGKIILSDNCTGDGNPDTVDLIVYAPGLGLKLDPYGNLQDAVKYNGSAGPHDIQWTGEFQCGKIGSGAHQDGLQMQSGWNMTLVNGKSGNWDTGAATCAGAGGATFYSSANGHFPSCVNGDCSKRAPVNILGGEFISCGKGLFGGNDTKHHGGYPVGDGLTGTVTGASYHTGGALFNGSLDPNCGAIVKNATPCNSGNTVTRVTLTCTASKP